MRTSALFTCALALVAVAGLAQAPGDGGAVPALFASPAAAGNLCPTLPGGASFATVRGGGGGDKSVCSATALCTPFPSVSCSTSTPGATCQAVDRNCAAGQQGFVRCNTSYTYCPICDPPECTEGAIQDIPTGNCCFDGRTEKERQKCIGGHWVFQSLVCKPPFLCPP